MKILHVTDTHLAPVGSRHRRDDFEAAMFLKLGNVVSTAHAHGVRTIVHTGDVFDLQNPRGVPRELIHRFGEFLAAHDLQWVLLAGQHDYRGRDPSASRYAPLSLLQWHPQVACAAVAEHITYYDLGQTRIWCVPYSTNLPELLSSCDLTGDVLAIHAMLVKEPVPWDHLLLEQVADYGPRLVLSGDYHPGFDPTIVSNLSFVAVGDSGAVAPTGLSATTFSNPGALARTSVSDAGRQPQVALVDLDSTSVEYIEIPCSSASDAFDLGTAARDKVKDQVRSAFAEKLSELQFTVEPTWDELAEGLRDEDPSVIEKARVYYQAAQA